MKVGDQVIATTDVYEHASGDSPGGYLCLKGELLIVRKVAEEDDIGWPLHVSHEHITDNSFGVHLHEVERKGGA